MKYKVGDYVIIIGDYKDFGCVYEYKKRKTLKNQLGKIRNKNKNIYDQISYNIEILNCPYRKECYTFKVWHYCYTWREKSIKSLNHLKLKKLIKHGV